jgi:hypothetical protein
VLWIKEQARMGIVENALGFFKPNAMLGPIASVFSVRPNRTRAYLDNI